MADVRLNQAGFSAIEVALVIITMGLAGGTGYYVVQKDTTPKILATAKATPEPTSEPVPPSPTEQKYLYIAEWNVRFPLSDETMSTNYVISGNTAHIGVPALHDQCAATADGGLASLTRFQSGDKNPDDDTPYPVENDQTIRTGDYYYMYGRGQATCGDSSVADKELVIGALLKQQIFQLQSTQ